MFVYVHACALLIIMHISDIIIKLSEHFTVQTAFPLYVLLNHMPHIQYFKHAQCTTGNC